MTSASRAARRLLPAALFAGAVGFVGHAMSSTPPPESATARRQRHARLVELHRQALALLTEAGDPHVAKDAGRRLRAEAGQRLEALVAESADPAGGDEEGAALLPAETRRQLQGAAVELVGGSGTLPARPGPLDSYLRLLAQVKAQLQGTPLGLSFQGSYSQTKKAEPVYGGHASAMGPPPVAPPAPEGNVSTPSPVQFEEAVRLPVKTYCGGPTKDHILESGGSGVALFDYDNDGLLDLFFVNGFELGRNRAPIPHKNALFRNLGNWKFEDVSAAAGVDMASWGNGVCVGDYDNDGNLDMYVTNFGPNFLLKNDGHGHFKDVAAQAGVAAPGWSTGCTFFDADGDGDLDLYVVRYVQTSWDDLAKAERTLTWRGGPKVMVGPTGLMGEADLFFENRGDGTFVEATEARGLGDPARAYGFGVVATDYDGDGRVDLFVANDTKPNFLYHNRGNGRFESVGLVAGVAVNGDGRAQAGMGVDSGDYDNDGAPDLVVTTFAQDVKTLYHNLGGGTFEDASQAAGLAVPTFEPMGWGVAFLDADLDGWLDLFIANGHIYPNVDDFPALKEHYRQKNQFLLNERAHFRDVSATAGGGMRLEKVGRGLAVGDLDNDGDLDVVVSNIDDAPTVLENRQRTGHHWISFRLEKAGRNRFAIGARVTIDAGGRRQMREVRSGGGYLSQNDLRPNFGLGAYGGAVDVEVRVPGGRRWRFQGLAPDQLHVLALKDD